MTDIPFGPGDYGGYNDWAKSGSGAFYTNWNSSTFGAGAGVLGRNINIAVRWDYASSICASALGHGDLWDGAGNLQSTTNNYSASGQADGFVETMHVSGAGASGTGGSPSTNYYWINSGATYYIGFQRDSTKCSIFGWKDGTSGGYAGKAGSDSTNGGGTANWGGTVNGGLPVYATITVTQAYVRRSSAWTSVYERTRRTSAWTPQTLIGVRRSGSMTLVNWLRQTERHIPLKGLPVEVNVGEGWEPGWVTEEGEFGWFGSVDPTTQRFDWTKPGDYQWEDRPWTGRFNSHESEEVAQARMRARFEWDQAMRRENYPVARKWFPQFQPDRPKPILEPEPILVPCGCG